MKTMQWDLSKAYEFVKERRPCISPNLHFMGQLLEFQKQLQESIGTCVADDGATADSDVDMEEQPIFDSKNTSARHSGMYFDVSITSYDATLMEEDFENSHTIASASAPSSLNFDNDGNTCIGTASTQVTLEQPNRTKVVKPKSLPLFQKSKSHCAPSRGERTEYKLKVTEKTHFISVSLPNTPISQSKNHLPACQSPVPPSQRPPQFSPCGMAATLESRSETCLNFYHTPLAESM